MIREWWDQQMDARRLFSLVLAAVALALCILALAADQGFVAWGDVDSAGFARYSPVVGGASGIGLRAYLLHRTSGVATGLRWALAQGGSMALLLFGMFMAATALNPIVSHNPALGGDTWLGIMATAVVLGVTANLMWERDSRRQRIAAILLLAVGFIVGGLIGLRSGGPWALIGVLSLSAGIIALVLAIVRGFSELRQEMAETAA